MATARQAGVLLVALVGKVTRLVAGTAAMVVQAVVERVVGAAQSIRGRKQCFASLVGTPVKLLGMDTERHHQHQTPAIELDHVSGCHSPSPIRSPQQALESRVS